MAIKAETTTEIDTDINTAWHVLSGLKIYPEWNSRTHFSDNPALNKRLIMRVKLLGFWLSVPVVIQSCNKEKGLRWQGGIPFIYTGSHYFKLVSLGESKVRLIQGEDFNGICVPLLWPLLKRELFSLYDGMNNEFKRRCEKSV